MLVAELVKVRSMFQNMNSYEFSYDRYRSTSFGKYFKSVAIGLGATVPSPQIAVFIIVNDNSPIGPFSLTNSDSRDLFNRRFTKSSAISASLVEPMRQGTHLPHDSA